MSLSRQGRPLDANIRNKIVNLYLSGESTVAISKRFDIPYKTVSNITDLFVRTGSTKPKKGGNHKRTCRTDDTIEYVEHLKRIKPSIYPYEIRKKLVENRVYLAENTPSNASVSRILRDDLGYSYKIIKQIPAETNRPDVQEKLDTYLAEVCPVEANRLHFFDESSVRTSGNRKRGHSPIGKPAFEMQKCASNATFTLNLLHNIDGVSHFNILRGPSNGLELLNFFNEALEELDRLENYVLKDGDFVVMDNCGFHHAQHYPSQHVSKKRNTTGFSTTLSPCV